MSRLKNFITIPRARVRKDVRLGDLLVKTKNGWYRPALEKENATAVYQIIRNVSSKRNKP